MKLKTQKYLTERRKNKGFECFPRHMKKYKAKEARLLRIHLAWMLAGHIVFIFMELFYYEFTFVVLFMELFYMWTAYNTYMTLNKWFAYGYIFLMFQAPMTGIFSMMHIAGDSMLKPVIYSLQLGVYGYCGVWLLAKQFMTWQRAKDAAMK
jgi:hypothetical protein